VKARNMGILLVVVILIVGISFSASATGRNSVYWWEEVPNEYAKDIIQIVHQVVMENYPDVNVMKKNSS
jgi:hypothetical protein